MGGFREGSRKTIEDQWISTGRHPSGFDYMRIALAVSVLLWHSYGLSYGIDSADVFWMKPYGLIIQLILPMFFCLSGFLVCASLLRLNDLKSFLALRVIRIFPALVVEICISALIIGPILTTLPLREYFLNRQFLSYSMNIFGWIHYLLPGVFSNNPLNAVNPSLWTIPYELECYIALSIVSLVGFYKRLWGPLLALVVATAIVAYLVTHAGEHSANPGGLHGRVLILCFLAGTVVYASRSVVPFSLPLSIVCLVASAIMFRYDATAYLAPVLIAYSTVYFGLCNPPKSSLMTSGDYSYGTYLYAGPIQQTVVLILGSSNNWLTNVLLSLPLTLIIAVLSWHLVEQPFQKVKSLIKLKDHRTQRQEVLVSTPAR